MFHTLLETYTDNRTNGMTINYQRKFQSLVSSLLRSFNLELITYLCNTGNNRNNKDCDCPPTSRTHCTMK